MRRCRITHTAEVSGAEGRKRVTGGPLGPQTLPSGYQPNCNPCFHPGIPLEFSYHDHVLTGAPGSGKNGTAGEFKAPWKIILLIYNPDVALSPTFTPITSASDIDAAEAAGTFLPINPGERTRSSLRRAPF